MQQALKRPLPRDRPCRWMRQWPTRFPNRSSQRRCPRMSNVELERFRQKLREYRLLVNRSQGDLAAYLNLDYGELSNRLNAHKNAHLSHDNVRTMVRALADWGAITTRFQAEELLDLLLCPHFDLADW